MKKPNIIYVICDQYRLQAMGFWSKKKYEGAIRGMADPVHTPNLDRFADESLVLTNTVSNCPLCSPHRAMLFSGRYPENNGVKYNCKAGRTSSLDENLICLSDVLHEEGYDVGYIGKLHLDMPKCHFDENGNYVGKDGEYYSDGSVLGAESCWDMVTPPGKKRHSIDFWYSYGTFDVHKNPHYWDNNCNKHEPREWSPKHETDKAISYIHNNESQRNKDKPFCLFVSMNPPHSPYSSLDDTDEEMFEEYYSENKVKDISELFARLNIKMTDEAMKSVRYYFSHISGIDNQFGRILKAINQTKNHEDTIVVFTSDHGEMMGSHGLMGKNVPYEESILVPFLIRYPKKISHRVDDLMMSSPDIMPTLLSIAGINNPVVNDLDGTDYSKVLMDDRTEDKRPKSALYIFNSGNVDVGEIEKRGVRTENYTFVIKKEKNGNLVYDTLFDNENDIYQEDNLSIDSIPKYDLDYLKKELGYWLEKSNDTWFQQKLFDDFIIYHK